MGIEEVEVETPGEGEVRIRIVLVPAYAASACATDDTQHATLERFVTEGLADGSLFPTVARTFPFDEIVEAHCFMEAGSQIGKIVVTV
jgi:NADPH:quinone reductase-like Zn-dependent oxidoreductase